MKVQILYGEKAEVMSKKNFKKGYKAKKTGRKVIIMVENAKTFNNPKNIWMGRNPAKKTELNDHSNGWGLITFPNFVYTDFKLNIPCCTDIDLN